MLRRIIVNIIEIFWGKKKKIRISYMPRFSSQKTFKIKFSRINSKKMCSKNKKGIIPIYFKKYFLNSPSHSEIT